MDLWNEEIEQLEYPQQRPRTLTVLGLLVGAAFTFSWLGSYAVTNALVAAGVMKPWSAGEDPRPWRMAVSFASFLAAFVLIAIVLKWFSGRQLRKIDRLAEEGEE
jgi:hypothetical protein